MIDNRLSSSSLRVSIDWWSVLIYGVLVLIGWVNIYAAVYDESHSSIFDISRRHGMQLIWIGVSVVVAIVIMLMDTKYYHMLAYPAYIVAILALVFVLFFGREVNGAKAWLFLGPVAIQPAEFVKFTTALAIARYMSREAFSITRLADIMRVMLIILLPVAIIVMQNDAGSAVVYGAFFIVLYREGMNGWFFAALFMMLFLFLSSFFLAPATILIILILVCTLGEGIANGGWRIKIKYLGSLALGTLLLYLGAWLLLSTKTSLYTALLISTLISTIFVFIYAYRSRLRSVYLYIGLFLGSLLFTFMVDVIFNDVLQLHQQKRILDLLGMESDVRNWGYNVDQSKIAIGSGGFFGNGFLEGTQTKYNFVPEQSTDFIFSTVGEEWGFVGCFFVISLFCLLIIRLMKMGERQHEPFGRIYCYSVASIFFVHVIINIGMTIGIMPVIGIPLPFFSYGGSSFLAFTFLFFVAVKLDSNKRETLIY